MLLHGSDYNPDQWLDRPDILKKDIEYMKEAGINEVSLGIFSWAAYEPVEGEYHFEWMDRIMDSMYDNGIQVILATPSGAKPPWLVKKYPEVMRTREDRRRLIYGDRENHCNSSVIYREKVRVLDEMLAKRYGSHPALIMWHISNEFYGMCHCEECQANFRTWLKKKYKTIDALNKQYNAYFWSHTYSSFEEIISHSKELGDHSMHALNLDYQRFYSEQTIDFVNMEKEAIRTYCKNVPITTNMHNLNCGVNYAELSKALDVTSWDSYPLWHTGTDKTSEWKQAVMPSFQFDFCRSLKKQPFYLMESTPSNVNWAEICKLKRPGMHMLSSLHAIASGSDSVQYFQWRQSRGGYEKFHGAVIGHNGTNQTRIYNDVRELGDKLKELSKLQGAVTDSRVAIVYDWNNLRALELQMSLQSKKDDFTDTILEYYEALLKNYVSVDVICQDDDYSDYDLIVAPMLYLWNQGQDQKIREYVASGGTYIMTAYSGLVNENDLAYESFAPYNLSDVVGGYVEETDALCPDENNQITYKGQKYQTGILCDILKNEGAAVLAEYEKDFYAGSAAVTVNDYQEGRLYYVASRMEEKFLYEFLRDVITDNNIRRIADTDYVADVMFKERIKDNIKYTFVMNYSTEERKVVFEGKEYVLAGYECKIIETKIN